MSRSPDVKYQRLSQVAVSEDEDEGFSDNILFDSRLVNGTTTDDRNVFELEELGLPRLRSLHGYDPNKRRRRCLAAVILILLIIATGCGIAIPFLKTSSDPGTVSQIEAVKVKSASDWNLTFLQTWTESSVFLLDIDKDKLDDIVIGLADQIRIEGLLNRPPGVSMRQYCESQGLSDQCGGKVKAFRGLDGKLLWETNTRSVVIHQTCLDMEVAGDVKSCVLTGRHSTCQAVEAYTGHNLWTVDPDLSVWSSHFVPKWNVYQAVVVPDMDGDTVLDVLVSHGGDKDKEPWDHVRQAGRLILLSGLNGTPIGKHFLELQDNKETYMPPVKYVTPSGAIYILIGTGGETVPGSLLAISLPDIYHHVTGSEWSEMGKHSSLVKYDWLDSLKKDQSGFVVLFSGQTKGIMVPPVLADMNKDGHADLIVTSFDGQVALIDGQSLKEKWSRTFAGMETYSSPTPGYYNEDSDLDWLVHFNEGVWDKYNGSRTLILSGADGDTLWTTQAESYAYSSDLSLQVQGTNSHMFIMKLVGMNSSSESVQEIVGLKKRHLVHNFDKAPQPLGNLTHEEFQMMCDSVGTEMKQRHSTCEKDLDSLTQDILLFDHTLRNHPLRILQQKAERFPYQLDHKPGTFHCHSLSEDKINMCLVLTPTSYTGAVGDVDGDEHLDYIHVTQMVGTRLGDTYNPLSTVSKVVISKRNMKTVMERKEFVHLSSSQDVDNYDADDNDDEDSAVIGSDSGNSNSNTVPLFVTLKQHIDSIVFQSIQGWCQYLGCRGDSRYHVSAKR